MHPNRAQTLRLRAPPTRGLVSTKRSRRSANQQPTNKVLSLPSSPLPLTTLSSPSLNSNQLNSNQLTSTRASHWNEPIQLIYSSTFTSAPLEGTKPLDGSTAPQNVSIQKVAQGWVINWSAPARSPGESNVAPERTTSEAPAAASSGGLLPALSQLSQQEVPLGGDQVQPSSPAPAAYSVEFREKDLSWQTLATSREHSLLLKDLRPGAEYLFRVFAHSHSGARGAPSAEFKYQIPDNRRKPGSTQALSAGVVSGVLFFIACIVIAVCAVNMCNKRRKKRAEKG